MKRNLHNIGSTKMTFDVGAIIGSSARMISPRSETSVEETLEVTPEILILRIAENRDRAAYAQLFSRFAPKLKAFMMGRGLNATEAEDLAQDALLNVWRKAHYFNPQKASAGTWIYSIARNLHIDTIRKAKRAAALPEDLWAPEPEANADDAVIDREEAKSVAMLMQTLPPEQKQVIQLSFFEDLSHGDIAKALSIPLGTVKSRMRLAMMRLRAGLVNGGRA